jgi:hypothetical protein
MRRVIEGRKKWKRKREGEKASERGERSRHDRVCLEIFVKRDDI